MNTLVSMRHYLASATLLASLSACPSDDGPSEEQTETSTGTSPQATDSSGDTDPTTTAADGSTSGSTGADSSDAGSSGDTTGVEGDYEPNCEGDFPIQEADPNYPWTPLSIVLESRELASGVFTVHDSRANELSAEEAAMATSAGFIIGDDGVVVVESMINQQLACQLYDLVREQTDLPILYVINTSHHGDHSYGNYYFGADTQIVQHEHTAAFISEHFEADREWMIMNFGANQGMEEVEPREADIEVNEAGWSVDLGGVTVEARYFGFAQTDGDLWVWVPEHEVMWAGNAQVTQNPGLPWLLDGNAEASMATMQAVREFLPESATLVPGHDLPDSPETLDFTISYLDTLLTEVQAAVDDGLTLEETIAEVTMEEFGGYVLFGWVHPFLNVTNTYADLTTAE